MLQKYAPQKDRIDMLGSFQRFIAFLRIKRLFERTGTKTDIYYLERYYFLNTED